MLMQELVSGYHLKSGVSRCAIKVLGFHAIFIYWIQACVSTTWFSVCFNGSTHGFFPSSRGLRQGDPLSPYLFIIIMDMFNELLNHRALHSDFTFHPKCKELGIASVCFADDMFILCGTSRETIEIVSNALKDFESELTYGDCRPLIERITKKIEEWGNHHLNFARRLVLINSVIFGKENYWCQSIYLPVAVIKKIEHIVRCFLWKGEAQALICQRKESLWVRWIATYRLKRVSFWVVEAKITDSWDWKQMLHNRTGVRRFLSNVVGNGKCTSFWYDSWHRMGVLADHFAGNARGLIRVPNDASVADAYAGR
ncbi:hypothetical protein LIER_43776 [Lithospermum erythrorhizon]|uniref:Reverse transcriptase domain-containing protein n=1 Tax=Lithospermum erythrorhizon TaxID=34254 RepID=A0AAV3QUU1_LITER